MATATPDNNGFIEIKDNKLSKPGVFKYLGREISDKLVPDQVYNVFRSPETLADPECIKSFQLQPWVIQHKMLGKNFDSPAEKKGIHGVIGQDVYYDEKDKWLKGNIKIFSEKLEDEIKKGTDELSLGFECDYDINANGIYEGQSYDVEQKKIRGNHLASVEESRMKVAVMDHRSYAMDHMTIKLESIGGKKMPKEIEDKDKGTGQDAILSALEKMDKRMTAMDEKMDAMEKKGKDMDMDKDKKDAKDEDKDDKDKYMDKDKAKAKDKDMDKKSGMDADSIADVVIAAMQPLTEKIESLEKKTTGLDSVSIMQEFSKRDELAGQLNKHGVAMDHSIMSHQKVAEVGVEKLGIPCEKGTEIASVSAYLHNRPAPQDEQLFSIGGAFAQDEKSTGESPIKKLLNGEA